MTPSNTDEARCPACGKPVTYYGEVELSNGYKVARYVIKCRACGYREVLQEVILRKKESGVAVAVVKPLRPRENRNSFKHARRT
ncbi:MAG: hypothetical protein QN229_04380 [Desulfurococcaceae archaeon TW002]